MIRVSGSGGVLSERSEQALSLMEESVVVFDTCCHATYQGMPEGLIALVTSVVDCRSHIDKKVVGEDFCTW